MSDAKFHQTHDQVSALPISTGPLLLTKLQPPRSGSDDVLRPRLMQAIERGVDRKLTLLITPAGYGKSTLVGQWKLQTTRPCAWISLDDTDNDFPRFLAYVVAAIQSLDPSLCQGTAALLATHKLPSTRQLVHSLVNEVAAATRQFVLVFDDYHAITSLEVQSALAQIIREMPVNLAIVIMSRQDTNLPVLRMEARGELMALGVQDLRFTPEETAEFLIEHQNFMLSPTDIQEIDRWAEGWPVALRMLVGAIRGRSREETRELLATLADNIPSVGSYLWDEVFESQPADRQQFLLQTSILDQFNPELCAYVTELPTAGDQLAGLERDNLFLIRLHGPGNWYRFHHLFAEALRQRMENEVGKERTRALHARAAQWHEDRQLVTEAAKHAVQAQDWERSSKLLVQICREFYEHERVGYLHTWLRNLPDEPLMAEPRLAYWLAWAQVRTGHSRESSRVIAIAEEASRARPSAEAFRAASQVGVLKSLFAANLTEGVAAAELLLQELGPEEDGDRARVLIMLGLLQQTGGNFAESERALEEARPLIDRIGIRGFRVAEIAASAILERDMGMLREPAALFRRAIAIGDEWNDLPLQNSHHKLGDIYYEWNRLDDASEHADIAERLNRQMGAKFHEAPVCLLRARVTAAKGHWDLAFDQIELAIARSSPAGHFGIIPILEVFKCSMWLATDQLTLAQGWLKYVGADVIDTTSYQDVPSALTGIRIRIHEGRGEETLAPLVRLGDLARNRGWNRFLLTIQTLHAIAALEAGHQQCAEAALEEALQLGVQEGFIRSFLDEGARVHPVLELAARGGGPNRGYAASLLEAAGVTVSGAHAPIDSSPSILSPRERDVMRLVAGGLSNREVGDALFISEETVKTHLRRVFEKLGVSSRTQAILRSQQLELL